MEWTDLLPILSLIIYLALGIYALLNVKKRRILAYAIFFYLMTLSIVSNLFFPIGTFMNERFVYISSIGACIAIGWVLLYGIPKLIKPFKPLYGGIALAVICIAYGYKTFSRIPAWKSPLTLNASAIKVSKNSARANVFTGTAWFNKYKELQPGPEKDRALELAAYYVRRSKELFPSYHNANLMLAGIVGEEFKRDGDMQKVFSEFTEIIKTNPRISFVYEFLDYLQERASTQDLTDFYYNAGKIILIDQQLKFNEGLNYLQRGLNVDPNNQRILEAMAKTYEQLGNSAKAQEFYNRMG